MNNPFAVQILKPLGNLPNDNSSVELGNLIVAIQERHQVTAGSDFSESVPNKITTVRECFYQDRTALTRSVVSL